MSYTSRIKNNLGSFEFARSDAVEGVAQGFPRQFPTDWKSILNTMGNYPYYGELINNYKRNPNNDNVNKPLYDALGDVWLNLTVQKLVGTNTEGNSIDPLQKIHRKSSMRDMFTSGDVRRIVADEEGQRIYKSLALIGGVLTIFHLNFPTLNNRPAIEGELRADLIEKGAFLKKIVGSQAEIACIYLMPKIAIPIYQSPPTEFERKNGYLAPLPWKTKTNFMQDAQTGLAHLVFKKALPEVKKLK